MASVVVGLGKTGASCLRYFARHGIAAAATDSRAAPPGLAELGALAATFDLRLGGFDVALLEGASQLLMSPGVPLDAPIAQAARARGIEVLGDVELFARAVRAPVIGITGTNGKSTVTSLVAHMAATAGRRVLAGGNLGVPALDLLDQPIPDLYVLELSSFQLETTSSLELLAAVVLNVTSDHLDRYPSIEAYARAKARIFARAATVVLNADDPLVAAMRGEVGRVDIEYGEVGRVDSEYGEVGRVQGEHRERRVHGEHGEAGAAMRGGGARVAPPRIVTFSTQRADADYSLLSADSEHSGLTAGPDQGATTQRPERGASAWSPQHADGRTMLARHGVGVLHVARMKITGRHNAANALAALALGEAAGLPLPAMLAALETFPGLPHRSAWVADVAGVRYIDDSKGTNVGATLAAVAGLPGPLVMILGGQGKGQDFTPLAAAFADKVRHAVLIGKDAPAIARALQGVCPLERAATMHEAVAAAAAAAPPGATVLLSPACASLDMFRDYAERGDVFAAAVRALPKWAPAGQAPAGQAPAGQAPVGQAPAGQAPAGQAPAGQAPAGQAPAGQVPAGSTPAGQAPVGSAPVESAPAGQAPVGPAPVGSAPVESAPAGPAHAGGSA